MKSKMLKRDQHPLFLNNTYPIIPNTMNFNEIEVNADDEHDYTVPDSVRERFDSAKKAEQEAAGAQGDG